MDIEPTRESVAAEFPAWHVSAGLPGGLVYARLVNSSPPVVVRGEDWLDLRDEIRGALARIERQTYWADVLAGRVPRP